MYGKLFNRLKKRCKNVTKSARSLRTSSQSNSTEAINENEVQPLKESASVTAKESTCSATAKELTSAATYYTYGQDLIDSDSCSLDDINNLQDTPQSSSKFRLIYFQYNNESHFNTYHLSLNLK